MGAAGSWSRAVEIYGVEDEAFDDGRRGSGQIVLSSWEDRHDKMSLNGKCEHRRLSPVSPLLLLDRKRRCFIIHCQTV